MHLPTRYLNLSILVRLFINFNLICWTSWTWQRCEKEAKSDTWASWATSWTRKGIVPDSSGWSTAPTASPVFSDVFRSTVAVRVVFRLEAEKLATLGGGGHRRSIWQEPVFVRSVPGARRGSFNAVRPVTAIGQLHLAGTRPGAGRISQPRPVIPPQTAATITCASGSVWSSLMYQHTSRRLNERGRRSSSFQLNSVRCFGENLIEKGKKRGKNKFPLFRTTMPSFHYFCLHDPQVAARAKFRKIFFFPSLGFMVPLIWRIGTRG